MKIFDGQLKYTASVHDHNIVRDCKLKLYKRETVYPVEYVALVTDADPQIEEGSVACYENQVAKAIKDFFEISDLILVRYYKAFDEMVDDFTKPNKDGQIPERPNQAHKYIFDRILFNTSSDYPHDEEELFDSGLQTSKYLMPIDKTILLSDVETLIEEKLFL